MRRASAQDAGRIRQGAEAHANGRKFRETVRKFVIVGCVAALMAPAVAAERNELIVQIVRPEWLPLPTVTVRVTNVKSCASGAAPVFPMTIRTTDKSGMATFEIAGTGRYRIEVPAGGGWSRVVKCVQLEAFDSDFPTAYVQLQVKLIAPMVTVRD
jgi:hypothetical protein